MGEEKTPSPCPCYLQQARGLAQGQENREPVLLPPRKHTRTNPVLLGRGAGTGESAPREGVKAGELALILSYAPYSNRETGPCTLLRQDSETGPGGVIMGEPDLKTQKQENWTHYLLQAADGRAGKGSAVTPAVTMGESWRAEQPSYLPGPEQGLRVGLPQCSPHL